MTRRAQTFLRLPRARRRMLMEAACLTVLAGLVTRAIPYRWHRRLYGRPASRPPLGVPAANVGAMGDDVVGNLRWALSIVRRYLPGGNRTCLPRALAGSYMLRRRGYRATVCLGAARSADGETSLHAWLLQGGIPITGVREAHGYRAFARFE